MSPFKAALIASAAIMAMPVAAIAGRAPYQHVLLISIDGMHGIDLQNYISAHPQSALAGLANRGVVYSNAYTTAPSDSFPGMVAQVTGATPLTAGIFYDDAFDRTLYAAGSNCVAGPGKGPGVETNLAESLDVDDTKLNGGGTLGQVLTQLDPTHLPMGLVNGKCEPIYPHQFIRANTVFEVIHDAGMRTAWADKHPAYEILNGPSGHGIDDLFTPEINSKNILGGSGDNTQSFNAVAAYDQVKVDAIVRQIDGFDSVGQHHVGVPAIFGMNFQEVSVGQKLAKEPAALAGNDSDPLAGRTGGYLDSQATPGGLLQDALDHTDVSLGRMVAELQRQGLLASTLIILTAKHGQSPIDPTKRQAADDGAYDTILNNVEPYLIAQKTTDDVALLWLTDQSVTESAVDALEKNQHGILSQQILAEESLKLLFPDPLKDSRTPDIIVLPNFGVIYTGGSKLAEHGGFNEPDTHVALLLSNPHLSRSVLKSPVETMQVAPTILKTLGLNPGDLQAVRAEGTQILPGF